LRSLSGGTLGPVARQWQDIQAFAFSPTSTQLVLRRRPAAAAPAAGAGRGGADTGAAPAAGGGAAATGNEAGPPRGVDVTVHDLKTDRDQLLGSVGRLQFQQVR
jgi:hypothetical protein